MADELVDAFSLKSNLAIIEGDRIGVEKVGDRQLYNELSRHLIPLRIIRDRLPNIGRERGEDAVIIHQDIGLR